DQHNRVIYSSAHPGSGVLQNMANDGLVGANAAAAANRTFRYTRETSSGRSVQLAARAEAGPGWSVFIEQPLVNLRMQSAGFYATTLVVIMLALGGAVLGARGFAGALTGPLEELVEMVRKVSAAAAPSLGSLESEPP